MTSIIQGLPPGDLMRALPRRVELSESRIIKGCLPPKYRAFKPGLRDEELSQIVPGAIRKFTRKFTSELTRKATRKVIQNRGRQNAAQIAIKATQHGAQGCHRSPIKTAGQSIIVQ